MDGQVGTAASQGADARRHGHATGGYSSAPTATDDEARRRDGKRGEEFVYQLERERVAALGHSPELVNWVSRTDELAPYDLLSVDGDGQRIYIEVKATRSANPAEPFFMSKGELLEAITHSSRYNIYRVTCVGTARPKVRRVADPIGTIRDGGGELALSNAVVTLALADEASP